MAYADEYGDDRTIEVQLRTQAQHQWAVMVERLSGRLQQDLKSGLGNAPMLAYLTAVSEAMAIEEAGDQVPEDLLRHLRALRAAVTSGS